MGGKMDLVMKGWLLGYSAFIRLVTMENAFSSKLGRSHCVVFLYWCNLDGYEEENPEAFKVGEHEKYEIPGVAARDMPSASLDEIKSRRVMRQSVKNAYRSCA
jgi:hypothetical protein